METIRLEFDERVLRAVREVADARHCTLEELITEIIERLGGAGTESDPLLGMFAAEPELMDQVVEAAMKARQEHPLRQFGG